MFRYVLISALAAILLAPSIAEAAPIRDIQIVGSERVEPETVKTYLPIQPGDELTDEALDSSLKALFNTGFFADVSVRSENNVVIVEVIENAVVNRIAFEGNDELDDEELRREITLRPRTVLTRTKVQNDLARLYQLYRSNGRFSANIDPKVIELDQNRVDLVFEITEGPVTEIRSIRFVGNENYDDSELRSVLSSKEDAWYRFLSNSDRYDHDRLAFDEEQLRRFYLSEGYADFRVLSSVAELSENKEDFYLTMTVDEGERYKVDGVFVHSSLQNFSGSVLKEEVTFEQGDWYNSEEVEASVDDMTQALEEYGYSFVIVAPDVKRDREN